MRRGRIAQGARNRVREVDSTGDPDPEVNATQHHAEPRWPMALAVFAAILLQVGTPHRGRVSCWWVFPLLELLLLGSWSLAIPAGSIGARARPDAPPSC